ncbi:glycoside hydrolase family 3 C-terminal domain-containing protein [Microbacterium sp. QXD-8]|uniref:Glycoside hydrolase family 3 C-terminal domain-containing protein n=1 Tax=Microbacterium psychrotolerans TaxID=3068321 RepID=A0ABU0Z5F2_9MICO|nr:glycoside hydrolase family 3 C-terminal domain-containing protein [Microbacterium sp. QXD-8]MDQ7879086.1 glycoside hydrolase family 3 C-terminal domain-containing protein [Microbacterium sp. QXD-8]
MSETVTEDLETAAQQPLETADAGGPGAPGAPGAPAEEQPLFRRVDKPLEARARDLLDRLTSDERLAMLHQAAPAIDRLGLSAWHTGCEALHGAAWLGRATVFPQPVGLAATWDTDLVEKVGEVAAIEVRAKRAENPLVSLNVWAPVVNTLRHPAWGRNEEGYSEDPHVTAVFGTAYSRGLRGDHPRVWRTVPALKHFLAYNNETDRSTTSSEMSLRTLHEEELPAFRGAIEAGAAGGIMLAYNRVNGIPAHTQPELVAEARSWTDESLAVVSDAGAPTFLVTTQRSRPDHVHAAAALVRSGLDSFTDNETNAAPTIGYLREALEAGLLTTDDIDRAVVRLLELRIRTGEFDGADDPYAGIGVEAIDAPEARTLARETVARSVVVLRNDDGVLPLSDAAKVAVVGPLADLVLTDWYAGTPPYSVGIGAAAAERFGAAEVVTGADTVALRAASNGRYVVAAADGSVVEASSDSAGDDALFDVTDWGDGILTLRSHASGLLVTGGSWPMRADAARVGGWIVQESFRAHVHADGTWSLLHLGTGRWVRTFRDSGLLAAEAVTLENAERFGVRVVRSGATAVAEAAARADAVIVAVGNDPHLAGRETEDRPHLRLPAAAAEVWRAAREANPHAVLTVVSSYPYVLDDVDAATVVWSSHGGQELGHGVIDVLSGDREPSGRLSQSWPATEEQAGDLFDYDTLRQGATYRHQAGAPAFAFGHGLTYAPVAYESVTLTEAASVAAPAPTHRHSGFAPRTNEPVVRAVVRVRNTGDRDAEELVQLYALPAGGFAIATPRRLLVAYRRVRLAPGEVRDVELSFSPDRLAVWDDDVRLPGAVEDWLHVGALRVQPGSYVVAAGPSAWDLPVRDKLEVTAR